MGSDGEPAEALAIEVVVPRHVERCFLHHWHPGRRLLGIGDREGPTFDGRRDGAPAHPRPLNPATLAAIATKAGTSGWILWCADSLLRTDLLDALLYLSHNQASPLVIGTSGHGDAGMLERLLPRIAAWVLFAGPQPGPQAGEILRRGRHVEVVLGLDEQPRIPDLPWGHAAAIHLLPITPAACAGAELQRRETLARQQLVLPPSSAALPVPLRIYDSTSSLHTRCRHCGQDLIWRIPGRTRLAALGSDGRCQHCATPADIVLAELPTTGHTAAQACAAVEAEARHAPVR